MTVSVVENPDYLGRNWQVPGTLPDWGIPDGEGVFQNNQVTIGAATAESATILIQCALPRGYSYRLVDARVELAFPGMADIQEWQGHVAGRLTAYSPSTPSLTPVVPFRLDAGLPFISATGDYTGAFGFISDGSALPCKVIYQGEANSLPQTVVNAESATTTVSLRLAMNTDTAGAGELSYYVRVLRYTISEENAWRMNAPILTV